MKTILIILSLFLTTVALNVKDCQKKPLDLSKTHNVGEKHYSYSLDYYYQKSLPYNLAHSFTDIFLRINLTDSDSYTFYQGENCSVVKALYENDNLYYGLMAKAAVLRSHQIYPFNDTIIGVSTSLSYQISVEIWKVNYVRLAIFCSAILLFILASRLVRNVVFYYTSGCSFGILASLLLVAFIVWRIAPKKTIGLPILIGGWSVSLYMLHFAWNNLQSIIIEYQKYVIGYFSLVILISWFVCYKRGPPTDARSHDIAQWTLQIVAMGLIYFSTQIPEVSLSTIAILVLQQILKLNIFTGFFWYFIGLATFWRKVFGKPRRFLTPEEYEAETRKTTKEQLELLRKYCKQDKNRAWELARKVKKTRRLAKFIENGEDVSEKELFEHDLTGEMMSSNEEDFSENNEDQRFFKNHSTHFYGDHEEEEEEEEDEDDDDDWVEIRVRRSSLKNNKEGRPSPKLVSRGFSNHIFNDFGNQTFDESRQRQSFGNVIRTPSGSNKNLLTKIAATDIRPMNNKNRKKLAKHTEEDLMRLRQLEQSSKQKRIENLRSSTLSSASSSEVRRSRAFIDSDSEENQ